MTSRKPLIVRAAILVMTPALLLGVAAPAEASWDDTPEKKNQRLLSLCDRKHADCSYKPTSYTQKVGTRRQVGDAIYNCSGTVIDHAIEWSDTIGHSSSFSFGATVGADVVAAVALQYQHEWTWSSTVTQKESLNISAWQVTWIERAPLLQTVTGDHQLKVHFPRSKKYGKHHVIHNATYTAPAGSKHTLVVNSRAMSDEEKAEVCVGGSPGPRNVAPNPTPGTDPSTNPNPNPNPGPPFTPLLTPIPSPVVTPILTPILPSLPPAES